MKSLQLLIGIICLSIFNGLSSGADLKIKTITVTEKSGVLKSDPPIPLLHTCYTGTLPMTVKKTRLEIGIQGSTNVIEDTFWEESTGDPAPGTKCKYFVGDISTYTDQNIVFIMGGQEANGHPIDDVFATAKFLIPESYIDETTLKAQKIASASGAIPTSLRLSVSTGGWSICQGTSILPDPYCKDGIVGTTPPCYAIEIGDASSYTLCTKDVNGEDAILEATIFTAGATTPVTPDPSDVVQLEYGYTESLVRNDLLPKLTVTMNGITNKLEFVPYQTPSIVYGACSDAADCTLTPYDKPKDMKILIMNIDSSDAATTSDVMTFKDYNIEGTHLGKEIIEMYWKKRAGEQYYGAFLDYNTDDKVLDIAVNCEDDPVDATHTYCYAYFIGLDHGSEHFVSVAPATITGDITDLKATLTNIITAEPQTTDADLLQITIHGVSLLQDSRHTDGVVEICFESSEIAHEGTRYEAIIIDEDSHWMKLYNSSQGEHQMQCFSSLNVLESSLRITKDSKLNVLVVQRELGGNKVLASGQAEINLSDIRIMKPDVDNGNNGSSSTLAIVGAAIVGIACLMALVAAAVMFVMKINRDNDGLQYPLHRNNIEDSNIIHGLENPIPTM